MRHAKRIWALPTHPDPSHEKPLGSKKLAATRSPREPMSAQRRRVSVRPQAGRRDPDKSVSHMTLSVHAGNHLAWWRDDQPGKTAMNAAMRSSRIAVSASNASER